MIWRAVGKCRPLPPGYAPPDLVDLDHPAIPTRKPEQLRAIVLPDLVALLSAATAHGFAFAVISAYRSEDYQRDLFARNIQRELAGGAADEADAAERANRYSAHPAHSEHQLGTTVDLSVAALDYRLSAGLGDLPEGRWLATDAWLFGFLRSYPAGSQPRTGYTFEPWHLRWVGVALAASIHDAGFMSDGVWDSSQPTLEEYLATLHPVLS
jgi:zinc D-Ala-D-Ala carboxypeptidase